MKKKTSHQFFYKKTCLLQSYILLHLQNPELNTEFEESLGVKMKDLICYNFSNEGFRRNDNPFLGMKFDNEKTGKHSYPQA